MAKFSVPKFESKDLRLWFYRALCIRVVNGDTAILYVDKGLYDHSVVKVRLDGVDAPEHHAREGSLEQRAAEKLLAAKATNRLKELIDGREVVIKIRKAKRFNRWLSSIYLPNHNEITVNQVLLDEQLVVKYGDPRPWRNE